MAIQVPVSGILYFAYVCLVSEFGKVEEVNAICFFFTVMVAHKCYIKFPDK